MSEILQTVLESYLESNDFSEGVKASTKASWGGGGYSVELFPDGTWRNLWNSDIGNLYESPGAILGLPTLDDSDYQECVVNGDMSEEEFFALGFANEAEELAGSLRDSLKEVAYA